jgi:hypothetical protein
MLVETEGDETRLLGGGFALELMVVTTLMSERQKDKSSVKGGRDA